MAAWAWVCSRMRSACAQAVAGALDLDDDGVMQEPVGQRGGDDGATEDLAPVGEAAVRCQE